MPGWPQELQGWQLLGNCAASAGEVTESSDAQDGVFQKHKDEEKIRQEKKT